METPASRLKKAREDAGFSSAREAALAMGLAYETYAQHESGVRGYRADRAAAYGRRFRVSPEWLLFGRGQQEDASTLSEDKLIEMVRLAVESEVTLDTRLADLPRIVGSNLHTQFQQLEADRAAQTPKRQGNARGKAAQSPAPTSEGAPEGSRTS